MKRRLIAIIAMVALAGTGAFAQLAIGISGAAYSNAEQLTTDGFAKAWENIRNGDGYLGFFVEVGMDNLAVGAAVNASVYDQDWGLFTTEMINVDANLYLQGHLLKYKSFIDPFLELGFGRMSKDFRNSDDDPDEDTPLMASYYWDVGGGLGINIGSIGIFLKGLYNIKIGEPVTGQYYGEDHVLVSYDLAAFPISNLKFIFGAKILF
jgi:hypothetical protein